MELRAPLYASQIGILILNTRLKRCAFMPGVEVIEARRFEAGLSSVFLFMYCLEGFRYLKTFTRLTLWELLG